jgi:hypothetical protein
MAKAKTDAEKRHLLLKENTRELTKLRAGRDFIWHVLSLCDIYAVDYTQKNHLLSGRRSVGIEVLQLLTEVDPTFYPRLILEKQDSEGNYERPTDDTDSPEYPE